jgi:hypothetical protein
MNCKIALTDRHTDDNSLSNTSASTKGLSIVNNLSFPIAEKMHSEAVSYQ